MLVRLSAEPFAAARAVRNSASVASGCATKQAVNWTRPAGSRRGAGPPPAGKAASEPLVRWRRKSLSTKEMETLNWEATW